jgi:serine/threonine-protein kinase
MDWGLAKVWNPDGSSEEVVDKPKIMSKKKVSSFTDLEQLQGTISYMSPEQIQRDPDIDFRTDIYSLGAVLFEILAGRPPSIEDTVDKLIEATLNEKPPKPSTLTKIHVPRLLEDVAMRCIAKPMEQRIQSCSELIRLLEEDWS